MGSSRHNLYVRLTAVTVLVLVGCGSPTDTAAPGSEVGSLTTVGGGSTTSMSTSTSSVTTSEPEATTSTSSSVVPSTTVPGIPTCGPGVTATLVGLASSPFDDPDGVYRDMWQMVDPPEGWVEAATGGFDWNQDGISDELISEFGPTATGWVGVRWDGGEIIVRQVRTDIRAEPVYTQGRDTPIRIFDSPDPRFGVTPDHFPAAVGDFNGDGFPDLVVGQDSVVAVLLGRGPASTSLDISFDQVGIETDGWRNEPRIFGSDVLLPHPFHQMLARWDVNGDGAEEYISYGEPNGSNRVPTVFLGARCDLAPL